MVIQCSGCNALHWLDECLSSSSKCTPRFGMCCYQGKVSLPSLQHPPHELWDLLTSQDSHGWTFHKHICNYNNALAVTSVGRKLDNSLNAGGGGPYSFRLHGELIHRADSLLPQDGQQHVYAQLYIHDNADNAHHCCEANAWNSNLNSGTLHVLQDMLWCSHPGVHHFK
jgi:hypothetical protein